jgi:hypothetical protein
MHRWISQFDLDRCSDLSLYNLEPNINANDVDTVLMSIIYPVGAAARSLEYSAGDSYRDVSEVAGYTPD